MEDARAGEKYAFKVLCGGVLKAGTKGEENDGRYDTMLSTCVQTPA